MSDYSHWSLIDEAAPAQVPLWREMFWGLEWTWLRLSPVYYGLGVPRGDGSAVVVVPGFLGTDLLYLEFRWWLKRMGYTPFPSRIGRNVRCIDRSGRLLTETLERAYKKTGRPVHLVGHSLGGILCRGVAGLRPELVASVTTTASPFRAIRAHRYVMGIGDIVRDGIRLLTADGRAQPDCFSGRCDCGLVGSLRRGVPEDIPHISIYSRSDGVVDWSACVEEDPRLNFEVFGSHMGIPHNPQVYAHVARFLHEVSERQKAGQEHEAATAAAPAEIARVIDMTEPSPVAPLETARRAASTPTLPTENDDSSTPLAK